MDRLLQRVSGRPIELFQTQPQRLLSRAIWPPASLRQSITRFEKNGRLRACSGRMTNLVCREVLQLRPTLFNFGTAPASTLITIKPREERAGDALVTRQRMQGALSFLFSESGLKCRLNERASVWPIPERVCTNCLGMPARL